MTAGTGNGEDKERITPHLTAPTALAWGVLAVGHYWGGGASEGGCCSQPGLKILSCCIDCAVLCMHADMKE